MIYSLKILSYIFDDNISWRKQLEIMEVCLLKDTMTDLSKWHIKVIIWVRVTCIQVELCFQCARLYSSFYWSFSKHFFTLWLNFLGKLSSCLLDTDHILHVSYTTFFCCCCFFLFISWVPGLASLLASQPWETLLSGLRMQHGSWWCDDLLTSSVWVTLISASLKQPVLLIIQLTAHRVVPLLK